MQQCYTFRNEQDLAETLKTALKYSQIEPLRIQGPDEAVNIPFDVVLPATPDVSSNSV
jgi:hypothetical protein